MEDGDQFFANKTAVVTGGMGALGSRIVERFLEAGMKVAVPVRSGSTKEKRDPLWTSSNERIFLGEADITQEDQVGDFLAGVSARMGPVDILVNAAGGYAGGEAVGEAPVELYDRMFNMNLRGAILMCSKVLPGMRESHFGRIVSIAAKPAMLPAARRGPYAISKRGIITLTETIAEEVIGTGITANAVAPSIILTEANRDSMPGADAGKWVTPEEIAELALFLCSWHARSISGTVVKIYGGV
jgi:NAD(P)-dependent dehydrogenase (short-subunit alcohol dehydrogenase family)